MAKRWLCEEDPGKKVCRCTAKNLHLHGVGVHGRTLTTHSLFILPPHCTALMVCSNNLTDLPDEIEELRYLRTLRLKYNQLKKLPTVVRHGLHRDFFSA